AYAKATGAVRFFDGDGRELDASTEMVAKVLQDWESPDRLFNLYGTPPWVIPPDDMQRRAIVEHVSELTRTASRLLLRVLDVANQIPDDLRKQIQEWEGQYPGKGWLRWLRYAVCTTGRLDRIENYAQVAVTGLMKLREAVGAEHTRARSEKKRPTL